MNVISRGVRGAFRNGIRTASIVVILGISIGLALAMLVARSAVQGRITSVKESVGNTVSISPAGLRGFEGGGDALTSANLAKVATLSHVTSVTETLNDRLNSESTTLQSSVEAGSFGQRAANTNGVDIKFEGEFKGTTGGEGGITRTFTPPIRVTGTNTLGDKTVFGGDSVTYTAGQAFDASKDEDVALVGKALAEKNSLQVGSTFTAYSKTVKVVGIYDAGNAFANAGVVMQLSAVQRLSGQSGSVSSAVATVDSLDNLSGVVTAVKAALGTAADVTSNQETADQLVAPLESVKNIAMFSLVGAIVASVVIILLTMVMIVRERRREIGVFKAIGASNVRVMLQFGAEAVTLTVLGLVAGLIIGAAAAAPVTNVLVNNSNNSSQTQVDRGGIRVGPGGAGSRTIRNFKSFGSNTLENARAVKASVGWSLIGYGLATAFVVAVLGSILPTFFIAKIRPAEVMRAD